MQPKAFRILSYRSIADTGWQEFSADGVTVLVGQNESGKSSILEALSLVNGPGELSSKALRSDGSRPEIHLRCELHDADLSSLLEEATEAFSRLARGALTRVSNLVEMSLRIEEDPEDSEWELQSPVVIPGLSDALREGLTEEDAAQREELEAEYEAFLSGLVEKLPLFSLFSEEQSSVPDQIQLTGSPVFAGQRGSAAAKNFVTVSGLDVPTMLAAEDRLRASMVRKANEKINEELATYWTQLVGKEMRIRLEVDFTRYAQSEGKGPGYLTFWVSESAERFYPSQRSKGTRWFLSVFLHLLATRMKAGAYLVMLDEPGSYLHIKAQEDVSRLIERIAKDYPVVYSTHSPELIDFSRLFRVLAVERIGSTELADTKVQKALSIACASTDTLTPILTRMGADFRHQSAVKHSRNVLLEEPSALHYFKAMALVLKRPTNELYWIAASGVNNVPTLFSLLTAWGIRFAVFLDDDKQAREVRADLRRNYFGDKEDATDSRIVRARKMQGVEDLFTKDEFHSLILESKAIPSGAESNSEFAKKSKIRKPVVSYQFLLRVEQGLVTESDFSNETKALFENLFDDLVRASS